MKSEDIVTVKERHEQWLMGLPGVVGVGVGDCAGQPCIKVYLETDDVGQTQRVPKQLEGHKVDVEVTGPIVARPVSSDVTSPTTTLMRVEMDIFSGRPNPEWGLSVEQVDELLRRLQMLPVRDARTPSPANLGYRGMIVRRVQDASAGFDELEIATKVVVKRTVSGAQVYADEGRALERWLLQTGVGRLDSEIDELIAAVQEMLEESASS